MGASSLLLAKALVMSIMDMTGRSREMMLRQAASPDAVTTNPWPHMLDKSLEMFKNLTSSGHDGAAEAYSLVFPGTLWCGEGTDAKSFDELGIFKGPDRCCRDHDHCPDSIVARERRHGLYNSRDFTSLLCACDHKFLHCLKRDGSVVARQIGMLYFDFLDPVCMTYDYPVKRCKRKESGKESHRCLEYELDYTRAPEWHFEDFPFFYASHRLYDAEDISTEGASALIGQEQPEVAANGEDAELWNALLMNRHVRFGTHFGSKTRRPPPGLTDGDNNVYDNWKTTINEQVFPGENYQ